VKGSSIPDLQSRWKPDHFCQDWFILAQWFLWRWVKCKKLVTNKWCQKLIMTFNQYQPYEHGFQADFGLNWHNGFT